MDLLGFVTLGIYTPLEAPVWRYTIIAWVPIDMETLYLHCSLIHTLGSFQLFLHNDQPLSERWK